MMPSEIPIQVSSSEAKISLRLQLVIFFIFSFVLAWLAWIPAVLNPKAAQPLSLLGLFAPAISAIVVIWWAQGKASVQRLFRRYTIWRFSIVWYLLAILLMPIIYFIAFVITIFLAHTSLTHLFFSNSPLFLVVAYIYLMVINSGEEIGWRGFALPALQTLLHRPVIAGLALGIIWALWHLPLYLNPEVATMPYPLFIMLTVGLSVIYTHLFNGSEGSLLPIVMLHAATDLLPRILQLTQVGPQFWVVSTIVIWLVATGLSLIQKGKGISL